MSVRLFSGVIIYSICCSKELNMLIQHKFTSTSQEMRVNSYSMGRYLRNQRYFIIGEN